MKGKTNEIYVYIPQQEAVTTPTALARQDEGLAMYGYKFELNDLCGRASNLVMSEVYSYEN